MKKLYSLIVFTLLLSSLKAQTLTGIIPSSGTAGTTVTAILTGQNTFFMSSSPQGIQQFHLGNNQCNTISGSNFVVLNEDSMQVNIGIPANAINGVYDVTVLTGPGQTLTLPAAFTITGGVTMNIQTFSPSTVTENTVFTATITGQNIQAIAAMPGFQITLGHSSTQLHGIHVTVLSTDTITAEFFVPAYSDTGYYSCNIYTIGNCFHLQNAVHVSGAFPKQLVSIAPTTGTAGTTIHALITGQNTFFLSASPQGGSNIQNIILENSHCNIYYGTSTSPIDGDHVNTDFVLPANATNGVYDVTVIFINGLHMTLPAAFTITGGINRSITGFTPATATAGTTFTATISGQGLADIIAHPPVTIRLSNAYGVIAISTVYSMSGNQLMADFPVLPYADSGYASLEIVSGVGCFTLDSAVYIINLNPPAIVSIVPDHGLRNENLTAIVTGSNTYFLSGSPSNNIYDVKFRQRVTLYTFDVYPPNIHVIDANHFSVDIHVPAHADLGWYDMDVYRTGASIMHLDSAFEVRGTLVCGKVFYDTQMDGVFNGNDYYLSNQQIFALPDSVTTTSVPGGDYFIGVEQGIDTIAIVPLTGWICTTPCFHIINVGATDTCGFDFGVFNTLLAIQSIQNVGQLRIYPNPTDGYIRFELPDQKHIKGIVRVIDQTGRIVRSQDIDSDSGEMDFGSYASGIYTVVVVTEEGTMRSRVVIY